MGIVTALLIAQAATAPLPDMPPSPPPVWDAPPPSLPSPPVRTSASSHPRPATPLGNPGYWATTDDYPPWALRQEREGIVGFRLTIDASGQVIGCIVTSSSGSPDLDEATCSLVSARARFRPATDAKGKDTPGTYSGRVRWIIPKDPEPNPFVDDDGRFVATEITYRFFIETDGTTSDCVRITNDTAEILEKPEGPCEARMPYKPYVDAKGAPVRKRVSITVKVALEDPPKP